MYYIVLSNMFFFKEKKEDDDDVVLKTCRFEDTVYPTPVELGCCPYYSTIIGRMPCNKHICPLVILIPIIFLVSYSIDIQSHIDS